MYTFLTQLRNTSLRPNCAQFASQLTSTQIAENIAGIFGLGQPANRYTFELRRPQYQHLIRRYNINTYYIRNTRGFSAYYHTLVGGSCGPVLGGPPCPRPKMPFLGPKLSFFIALRRPPNCTKIAKYCSVVFQNFAAGATSNLFANPN